MGTESNEQVLNNLFEWYKRMPKHILPLLGKIYLDLKFDEHCELLAITEFSQ